MDSYGRNKHSDMVSREQISSKQAALLTSDAVAQPLQLTRLIKVNFLLKLAAPVLAQISPFRRLARRRLRHPFLLFHV
jgi:hypothetical protein